MSDSMLPHAEEFWNSSFRNIYFDDAPVCFTKGLFLNQRNTSEDGYACWYQTWSEVILATMEVLNENEPR